MNELLSWFSKGFINVHVSHKFPLSQVKFLDFDGLSEQMFCFLRDDDLVR